MRGPWPSPAVDAAEALAAKYAADWPAWGYREIAAMMRADGHRASTSTVERAQRLGRGGLHVAHAQAAHEPGDDQRFQRVGAADALAEQSRGERLGGAAHLRPLQRDGPDGGLDGHLGMAVAIAVAVAVAAGVALTAQEGGHFGFQGGLKQQAGAESGDVFQVIVEVAVAGEQLVDPSADTLNSR